MYTQKWANDRAEKAIKHEVFLERSIERADWEVTRLKRELGKSDS